MIDQRKMNSQAAVPSHSGFHFLSSFPKKGVTNLLRRSRWSAAATKLRKSLARANANAAVRNVEFTLADCNRLVANVANESGSSIANLDCKSSRASVHGLPVSLARTPAIFS